MKRARHFRPRLIRRISLFVCLTLVFSSLTSFPFRTGEASGFLPLGQDNSNGRARRVPATPPQPGPPQAKLPNLDNARSVIPRTPKAPDPIPSTGEDGGPIDCVGRS